MAKVPEYQNRKAELELLLAELQSECTSATRHTIEGLKVALAKANAVKNGLAKRMMHEVAVAHDGVGVCYQDEVVAQLKTLLTDDEKDKTRELYSLAMEAE